MGTNKRRHSAGSGGGFSSAAGRDRLDRAEAEEFRQFLDQEKIAAEDRVIRRIALRGVATRGVAVTRSDLVPEVTITVDGVYWHPVGAEDVDLLVTLEIFPLSESFAAVRRAFDREGEHANKLARIFNCA